MIQYQNTKRLNKQHSFLVIVMGLFCAIPHGYSDEDKVFIPASQMRMASLNGYFVEVDFGHLYTDWNQTHQDEVVTSDGQGGFTYGLGAGYQWGPHFSFNAGFYAFPTVHYEGGSTENWLGYTVVEFNAPLYNSLLGFIDAGAGFWRLNDSTHGLHTTARPLMAAGVSYHINDSWAVLGRYSYFDAQKEILGNIDSPADNLLNIGIKHVL